MRIAKENPKLIQIWFMDESGFSLRVIRRKCWGKKGKRVEDEFIKGKKIDISQN